MHYGRYYCAKLAGLFLFKVTPIVRTCIISISWKIIDNDNDNNNDDDDNDKNCSANTEISIKTILKFRAVEGKPDFCPKPKPDQIGSSVDAFQGDDDCSGSEKCCFNACGHVCIKTTRYVNQHGFPISRLRSYEYAQVIPLSVHY